MLKKLITILTYILLFLIVAVVLYNEGCLLSGGETAQMRDIPQIEQAQMRALESQSQHSDRAFLTFSFEGYALPLYDAARDCYLICESMLDQISVAQNIRCDVFMTRTEHGAQILAQKGADCRIYSFETTPLPILFLETGRPDAQPIGEQESSCLVTVLDAETGHLTQQTATIKIRGGLSRQYPKTGALIKLIDTRGKEVRATLAGLPENTEFALNSLYEDDSKMRDIAALSLWKAISTQDRAPGYELEISFEMTEVFINGAYAGLYGLHENVNLASFDLADRDGFSIFKSKSHATNRWEDGELYAESWGDVELKESNAQDAWSFFEEAFARMFYRLAGEGEQQVFEVFDRDNCIDYTIWCNLLVAEDNLWKNTVLITDQSDPARGKVYVVPWDADLTLGARFSLEVKLNTLFSAENAERELTTIRRDLYGMLWSESGADFQRDAAQRWFALRAGVLEEETLQQSLQQQFDLLSESGARARDAARWPDSAQSADNAFIQAFITDRLRYLDAFYAGYLQAQDE